jgi:hypothetical protein
MVEARDQDACARGLPSVIVGLLATNRKATNPVEAVATTLASETVSGGMLLFDWIRIGTRSLLTL